MCFHSCRRLWSVCPLVSLVLRMLICCLVVVIVNLEWHIMDREDGGHCLGCQPRRDDGDCSEGSIPNSGVCCNDVTDEEESLQCDECSVWHHSACTNNLVSKSLYQLLKLEVVLHSCLPKLVTTKDENAGAT